MKNVQPTFVPNPDWMQSIAGTIQKRIRTKHLADYRAALLAHQGGICILCQVEIPEGKDVLDHNHKTGRIRGVLHRSCNALLGHIENNYKRFGMEDIDLLNFLDGAHSYAIEREDLNSIHPTFRTPVEKKKRAATRKKNRNKKMLADQERMSETIKKALTFGKESQ